MSTSTIFLTEDWYEIATGACVMQAIGSIGLRFEQGPPAIDDEYFRLTSNSEPFDYDGTAKVWARAIQPVSYVVVSGDTIAASVDPTPGVAPSFTTPPSITPSDVTVGETITLNWGAVDGSPDPKVTGELSVDGVRLAHDADPIIVPRAGQISFRTTAHNGVAPNAIATATAISNPLVEVGENTTSATLSDLAVPQAGNVAIFDSGAARGANAANIPLSGTTDAPDGAQVEARVVRADTGAQVHGWVTVATASGGAWSGDYPLVTRNSQRLSVEVRPVGSTAPVAVLATEFMVGHVIVLIGQSEDARMFGSSFDKRTYQTVPAFPDAAAQDSFFIMTDADGTYASNGVIAVNETTPWTASVAHLANTVTRNAPGEKFLFIEGCQSGTYRADLADSPDAADDDRGWGESFYDAVQLVRGWGSDVGVVMDTWTAADGGGESFRGQFFPFHSGLYQDGTPYTLGVEDAYGVAWPNILFDVSGTNGGVGDHVAFDETVTKHAFHGPHRFEDSNTGQPMFVDPAGTYTGAYVSDVLDITSENVSTSNPLRVNTQDAGGAFIIEGSADGSTGWTEIFSSSDGDVDGLPADELSAAYDYLRLTATAGGKFFVHNQYPNLLDGKEGTRTAIRSMVSDPALAGIMRPKGPEILLYLNGTPTSITGDKAGFDLNGPYLTDYSHPSDYSDDGLPARARHTGVALLYALGIGPSAAQNHYVPKFNRAYWEPNGLYVDLWYEAPDGSTPRISTTRLERGDPALPGAYPHHTEVSGIRINDAPAERAEIVNDRVRVYPNPLGAFVWSDVINYGQGGASGNYKFPEDPVAQVWKNLPIAVMGFDTVDGIAIEPLPDEADIANSLPAPALFSTALTGPSFSGEDPVSNTGQLTWAAHVRVTEDTNEALFGQSGRVSLNRPNGSQLSVSIKDTDNFNRTGGVVYLNADVPLNVFTKIVFSIDLAAQVARVWINDLLTDDIALAAGTTDLFDTGRALTLITSSGGGTSQIVGEWEYVRSYLGYTSDGDVSGLTVFNEVTGPAASANASPYKSGDDAV